MFENNDRPGEITRNYGNCLENIFKNRTSSVTLKIRIFQALVESIFLYNSECWGLNKVQEQRINITQRQFLRRILGIRWHKNNWISNENLYERTEQQKWSTKIAHRRFRFFGYVARLPENAPAKPALYESIRKTKKPKGKPQTILINVIKRQLKELNILCFSDAIEIAQNRDTWRKLIAGQAD